MLLREIEIEVRKESLRTKKSGGVVGGGRREIEKSRITQELNVQMIS